MSEHTDDPWVPPRVVADHYGVDVKTVTRWANDGKISYILTPGGHRRYRMSELPQQSMRRKAEQ